MANKKQGGAGAKKHNRSKKKAAGRATVLSAFVRGKMSGEEYFKLTGQK